MEPKFWDDRWHKGETGWHQEEVNPLLMQYWPSLELPEHCPVFVPLCGKSKDMIWLREVGHRVIGVELVESAVRAFFEGREGPWKAVNTAGVAKRFSGGGIHIYCGDYLELSAAHLEAAPGAFDRGALIALPPPQRAVYADHMQRILPNGARVLLITLEYDQDQAPGPPFSVAAEELHALYGQRCQIRQLEFLSTELVPPHFKDAGLNAVREGIYLITKVN